MKILLVNSPIWLDKPGVIAPVEPLGILYLAACLLKAGHKVRIGDLTADSYDKKIFLSDIEDSKYDIIGFSCRTASYSATLRIIQDMRSLTYKPIILMGGNHPTALPELTLNDVPGCIVVRGEGEITVVELIGQLERFGTIHSLSSIKGLSYKLNDKVLHNPERELIADLDTLPFPARHLLNIDKYNWKIADNPAVNVLSSRGCPFNCIYCFKSIFKNKIRYRSAENIITELKEVKDRFGRDGVYFVDDHFTFDNSRLDKFFRLLKESNLNIKWRCLTRVDGFDDVKFLERMKENGCDTIIFGAESGDADTLIRIRKGITLEQSRKTILAAQKSGINLKVNFMLGFPWETYQSVYNTIKFAADFPPFIKEYAFYFVTPFPGTQMWEQYCYDSKFEWKDFTEFNPFFKGKTISDKDYPNLLIYASLYVFRKYYLKELFRLKT